MRSILLGLLLLGLFTVCAHAIGPVEWEENGHWYELVEIQVTWEEARIMAENRIWMGTLGHLATITSKGENRFVYNALLNSYLGVYGYTPPADPLQLFPWIGGYQDPVDSPPNLNWRWVTDEPWDFTSWDTGEPNDCYGWASENCLDYWCFHLDRAGAVWNDDGCWRERWFIVEYSPDTVPVRSATWGAVKSVYRN